VAYLGLRGATGRPQGQPAGAAAGETVAGRDWLVAVHAATGRLLTARPLAGAPAGLSLAPTPGGVGSRLYAVESLSDPAEESPGASRGRLLGLNPVTLDVESAHGLDSRPVGLAVAPDGEAAYALTAYGSAVTEIDLVAGAQRRLAALPENATALAVAGDRVYVPNPWGDEVWVIDRRGAQPVRPVRVGRNPQSIALGGAA
jgi:DNA-binding beta-propeller fold protein YncE